MGHVILGAILGLALGAALGVGGKYLCEDDSRGNLRKYSRLLVYKQNNAADLIEGIDIAPAFPLAGACFGSVVGSIAGCAAAVTGAIRRQSKTTAP
jgi:hypothetical protein